MSSDLSSGKNKKFTKESVYIMLSEKLGKLFYQKTQLFVAQELLIFIFKALL